MKLNNRSTVRAALVIALMLVITFGADRLRADTGTCGGASTTLPFTDLPASNGFFCAIASAYFTGLTNGTTATTYSPSTTVPREQMAAFVTRTMDQSLKRGSRRAILGQYWTPTSADGLGLTSVGTTPNFVRSDGFDLWVANANSDTVSRVRASDGKLLGTWTGALAAYGVLVAKGLIFVTGKLSSGKIYQIDPTQPVGGVTTLAITLGINPEGVSFDGTRIWTANIGNSTAGTGSVSIVTLNPLSVTTVTTGFLQPTGILYDGANMWVTDWSGNLRKLDSNGNIIQTVLTGSGPYFPVFDGTNIWVPNYFDNTVSVVRASTGAVLATLTGNGMTNPVTAAFDGERILVTNMNNQSVSLWKAADLTPIGSVATGPSTFPMGACSDGLNFWITMGGTSKLVRF